MENLKDEELSSLWIDKPDILEKLNSLDFSQYKYLKKENITEFEKSGFTIIKNAIPNLSDHVSLPKPWYELPATGLSAETAANEIAIFPLIVV